MKLIALLIFALSAVIITPANAQDSLRPSQRIPDRSYTANPHFEHMARQAIYSMPKQFRFGRFRDYYMQTRQYTPIADEIIDEITRLSYIIQNSRDSDAQNAAILEYRTIVKDHMANIRVVMQALSLSRIDGRFGNPEFFEWLRDGLIRDLMNGGDGKTLRSAYQVISMSEEGIIMQQLGLKLLSTQSEHEGILYYNMHNVQDIRTGQRTTLFVNTTYPIKYLNQKNAEQAPADPIAISRQ